jgi:hypothetical protein
MGAAEWYLHMVKRSACLAREQERCPLVAAGMLAHRSWTWLPVRAEEGAPAERDYLNLLTHSAFIQYFISIERSSPVILPTTSSHIHQRVVSQPRLVSALTPVHLAITLASRPHRRTFASKHLNPPKKSHAPIIIHDSMSALKDKTSSDMPGPIGNHEPDTETMSELADDMALCMTMSTPVTGQKNAIGTKEGPHEARLWIRPSRSSLADFKHRATRSLLSRALLYPRLCTPPRFSNSSSHTSQSSTSLLLPMRMISSTTALSILLTCSRPCFCAQVSRLHHSATVYTDHGWEARVGK